MSYIKKELLPDEQLIRFSHAHPIIFFWPILVLFLSLALWAGALGYHDEASAFSGITSSVSNASPYLFAAALVHLAYAYLLYRFEEFAVTNRRVMLKNGVIHRKTLELMIDRVETISVDQHLIAMILRFGTLHITGTGSQRGSFKHIPDPNGFRRDVIENADRARRQMKQDGD
ncbi:PH domain-containing protein [Thioalkalivibrio thiocyanodenitrificans]|uniref:PH domain-containing protein n=1 Tax=Thioalkalivibrio thiocyanodenitrificans TaxID=243063 RepID=UPI00035F40A1|nr:PH domain-containing protein [Thioalkalivibrio thiocyanodenitrificans]